MTRRVILVATVLALLGAAPAQAGTLAAGGFHTCALDSANAVHCWGDNGGAPTPAGTFKAIAAADMETCAISTAGSAYCWGPNLGGTGTTAVTRIATGYAHACGLHADGTVECWGDDSAGQASPPGGGFTDISANGFHTCAIATGGTLDCWGEDTNGASTPPGGTYTAVSAGDGFGCAIATDSTLACWGDIATPPSGTFTSVSAGTLFACGVRTDSTVACWGDNAFGQTAVPNDLGTVVSVSAGGFHACALKTGGALACWGMDNGHQAEAPAGDFGHRALFAGENGTCAVKTDSTAACWGAIRDAPDDLGTVRSVAAGRDHACAIKTDSTVACWGSNTWGQLNIAGGLGTVNQISAGYQHTCAIKTDGTVACWGWGGNGQLSIPGGLGTATKLVAGISETCAIKTDATLACWGSNTFGETSVPGGLGTVTDVGARAYTVCALKTDTTVACWGFNNLGGANVPGGLTGVASLAVGHGHACALKADGTATCWGYNAHGQRNLPSVTFTQLIAGVEHTCGLEDDGRAECWGYDDHGQRVAAPALTTNQPSWAGAGAFSFSTVDAAARPGATYRLAFGSLPTGLALDAATGEISGTATQEGSFGFGVVADNGLVAPATANYAVDVDLSPPTVSDTLDAYWHETPVSVALTASDSRSGLAHVYYSTGASPGTPVTEYDPTHKPMLSNGERIRYYAVDAVGNASTPVTSAPAKVDGTYPAPPTLINLTQSGSSAHIAFSGEPDAEFVCVRGSDAPVACTSPVDLTGLPAGTTYLHILQRDPAGHVSQPLTLPLSVGFPQPPLPPLPPLPVAPTALAGASGGKAFVLVTCPVACRATSKATVSVGAKKVGTLSGKLTLAANATGRVQLKPSAALKRKLRGRKATMKVTTTIVGSAGTVTTTATLKVSRLT